MQQVRQLRGRWELRAAQNPRAGDRELQFMGSHKEHLHRAQENAGVCQVCVCECVSVCECVCVRVCACVCVCAWAIMCGHGSKSTKLCFTVSAVASLRAVTLFTTF